MHYLSETIMNTILAAVVGSVFLLSAPMGSGKTFFVIHWLWSHCRVRKQNILLVVNRSSLRGQLIKEICMCTGLDYEAFDTTRAVFSFDNLTVVSYQYLEYRLKEGAFKAIEGIRCDQFDFVIFDEAHYLVTDSLFNKNTYYLKDLRYIFSKSVRVYMSATMSPVRNTIFEIEDIYETNELMFYRNGKWGYHEYVDNSLLRTSLFGIRERKVYELQGADPDFSYIHPIVFDEEDSLSDIIKDHFVKGEKWLVFVDSLREATDTKQALQDDGINAAIIAAENHKENEPDVMNEILKKCKFSCDVVLATTVIYNGVSLKDRTVKNVVISGTELITAVQQAGRVRVTSGQNLNLWIRRRSIGIIKKRKEIYQDTINKMKLFEKLDDPARVDYLIKEDCEELKKYLVDRGNHIWAVNPLAYNAICYLEKESRENVSLLKADKNAYVSKVLGWFGFCYTDARDIHVEKADVLTRDLQEYIDMIAEGGFIPDKEKDAIFSELKMRYEAIDGPVCKDHKDRPLGPNTAKKIFEKFGYTISNHDKKKNGYAIERRTDHAVSDD